MGHPGRRTLSQAFDVNPLVYAADDGSPYHAVARELMRGLFAGHELTFVFWPVVMAYLRLTTSAAFARPLSAEAAMSDMESLLALPHVRTGAEGEDFWRHLRDAISGVMARGKLFPDAHLVALMRQHGVRTIITHDRDFRKFDGIRVIDPFA